VYGRLFLANNISFIGEGGRVVGKSAYGECDIGGYRHESLGMFIACQPWWNSDGDRSWAKVKWEEEK